MSKYCWINKRNCGRMAAIPTRDNPYPSIGYWVNVRDKASESIHWKVQKKIITHSVFKIVTNGKRGDNTDILKLQKIVFGYCFPTILKTEWVIIFFWTFQWMLSEALCHISVACHVPWYEPNRDLIGRKWNNVIANVKILLN
jgi:hypothetical protein